MRVRRAQARLRRRGRRRSQGGERCPAALWIPAFAGMTGKKSGMTEAGGGNGGEEIGQYPPDTHPIKPNVDAP